MKTSTSRFGSIGSKLRNDPHHQDVHRVPADVVLRLGFPVAQVPNTFLSISVMGESTNFETTKSGSVRGLHELGVRQFTSR